jgi:hypothetical protein
MNIKKQFFFALSFACMLGAFACTTTDTASTESEMTDSTQMTMPENTGSETDTSMMNNGTGGDTSMNNDGMKNDGGTVVDSNNIPNKDGRLPVRGKNK